MAASKDKYTLLDDMFYIVLVSHISHYQKGGRGAVQIYLSILKGVGGLRKAKI